MRWEVSIIEKMGKWRNKHTISVEVVVKDINCDVLREYLMDQRGDIMSIEEV